MFWFLVNRFGRMFVKFIGIEVLLLVMENVIVLFWFCISVFFWINLLMWNILLGVGGFLII